MADSFAADDFASITRAMKGQSEDPVQTPDIIHFTDENGGADKAWEEMIDKRCASLPGTLYVNMDTLRAKGDPIGKTVGGLDYELTEERIAAWAKDVKLPQPVERSFEAKCKSLAEMYGRPWTTVTMKEDCQDENIIDEKAVREQVTLVLNGVLAFLSDEPNRRPKLSVVLDDIDQLFDWVAGLDLIRGEKSNG